MFTHTRQGSRLNLYESSREGVLFAEILLIFQWCFPRIPYAARVLIFLACRKRPRFDTFSYSVRIKGGFQRYCRPIRVFYPGQTLT